MRLQRWSHLLLERIRSALRSPEEALQNALISIDFDGVLADAGLDLAATLAGFSSPQGEERGLTGRRWAGRERVVVLFSTRYLEVDSELVSISSWGGLASLAVLPAVAPPAHYCHDWEERGTDDGARDARETGYRLAFS